MDTFIIVSFSLLIVLLLGMAVRLFLFPKTDASLSTPLQNLTQAVQQGQAQSAVLIAKIEHLEPIPQEVGKLSVELRGLSERVSNVEKGQNQVTQGIASLGTGLTETKTVANSLVDATTAMRGELSRAKTDLTELQTHTKARQELELRTAESIRRLEAVIAGTQTKGAAGENVLEVLFAKLPPDWQVRNFRVGAKTVEFGLRLPNNLILPIDSKWPATGLLEEFIGCDDPDKQQKLKAEIEAAVLTKAKEVRKYIDPNVTMNFGVAAVPDSVYDLCFGIQVDVFQLNVVLISYSMFVPYLLLVFQTMLKTSQNIDLQKLEAYLKSAQENIKSVQDELEGRFPKAITMLNNSRDEMSAHLSKVAGGLTSLQISAPARPAIAASTDSGTVPEIIDQ
jgi:DNA recombination protein RmuC